MSLPDEPERADDRQLARYLLGLLPDEEIERLDEASIADDEVASRLRIVENDLVDAYVRGDLTGEMLERFEARFLASPRRRQRARFAENFLRAVDRADPADPEHGGGSNAGSTGQPPEEEAAVSDATADNAIDGTNTVQWPKLAWVFMAAAAALIITCATFFLQTVRLRSGLELAQKESVALDRRVAELARQIDEQRAANAALTKELEKIGTSTAALASRSTGSLAALVLLPQMRSVGPVATLDITPGAERVTFDLRLESNDFARYEVALTDPGSNQIVWRSGPLTSVSRGDTPFVTVVVPVRVLKPQHYSFALTGRRAGSAEVVGSYTFQVERR